MVGARDEQGYAYQGSELELFAEATNWKRLWSRAIAPRVGARVLDVGAGIGANIPLLMGPRQTAWLALEPDAALADRIREDVAAGRLPAHVAVRTGTLAALSADETFDTILYIDVLEHIEDDRGELARAASHLAPGGTLVVLAPAHQFLFTPFDRAIGHFRRYDRRSLAAAGPAALRLASLYHLDSAGMLASAMNRLFLRSAMPTRGQIRLWDRALVPLSRVLDPLLAYRVGKSVVGVWERAAVR